VSAADINHENFHAIHYCIWAVHTREATGHWCSTSSFA
jgi:hypothetical protein